MTSFYCVFPFPWTLSCFYRGTCIPYATLKSSSSDPWRTWVVAACGEKDGAVVIAHPGDEEEPLVLNIIDRAGARPSLRSDGARAVVRECRITDEVHTNEIVPLPSTLPPHSFLVVLIDSGEGN